MKTSETKNPTHTGVAAATDSTAKLGGKLRRLAGGAADTSVTWARRCGEALSDGAQFAALQAKQTRVRRSLGRAYEQLGRALYALHGKEEEDGPFAEVPELRAALQQVKEAKATLDANGAKLAELRKTENRGDSTSS